MSFNKMMSLVLVCLGGFLARSADASPAVVAEVDLDADFLRATTFEMAGTKRSLREAKVADFKGPRGWDGSTAFPPVVKQSPFGACQSFSMTAMMEYLFFRETGKTLKLSEKYVARSLLELMIDAFWNKEKNAYDQKPNLGLGIAPYMIETVTRFGMMPDADYPWGSFSVEEGSRTIDVELFKQTFETPTRDFLPDEYKGLLDRAFLSPPPGSIYFTYRTTNFESGKPEEVVLRSPLEINQAIGIEKSRFLVLHNKDMNPTFHPLTNSDRAETLRQFDIAAAKMNTRSETVTGQKMIDSIVASLNSRMVALIAADVWVGSWTEQLVYVTGGGHGVVVVGYQIRDGEIYFKIRNSWGSTIGVGGYNFVAAAVLLPNLFYAILYQ